MEPSSRTDPASRFAKFRGPLGSGLFALPFLALTFASLHGTPMRVRVASSFGSFAIWALLGSFASRKLRWGPDAFLATFGALWLTLHAFSLYAYRVPLSEGVVGAAVHHWSDVAPTLRRSLPIAGLAAAACFAILLAVLRLERSNDETTKVRRFEGAAAAVALLALILVSPLERNLVGIAKAALLRPAETPATPSQHFASLSVPKEAPLVLLVLTESIRATDHCSELAAPCEVAPFTHRRLSDRVLLSHHYSLSTYTTLVLRTLLTGLPPTASSEQHRTSPTLFELFAKDTLYIGGHSAWIFEGRSPPPEMPRVTLETLLGREVKDDDEVIDQGIDRKVVDRFVASLDSLRSNVESSPHFLFLHLAGTHAPYFVDPGDAPFRPYLRHVDPRKMPELHAAYRNSIHAQDKELDRAYAAFIDAAGTRPWVIVFGSDHGEAFDEHHAIHHGQNLYPEQVHVPAYVASGNGALSGDARIALAANGATTTTHIDLFPTLLALLRPSLNELPIQTAVGILPGRNLLRRVPAFSPIPLTNCTELFRCPVKTWGLLGEEHLLVAQEWDGDWNCVSLASRSERLSDAPCSSLRVRSKSLFPNLPNGQITP